MRMVVDLPAPFGPRNLKISPRATSIDTLSTATKSPNRFVRFSMRTAGPYLSGRTISSFLLHQRYKHVLERRHDWMSLNGVCGEAFQ